MATEESMAPMRVEEFLGQKVSETSAPHKELEFDLGNLLAVDVSEIDQKEFRKDREQFMVQLTRDNTQLLINELHKLPVETHENVPIVKLPEPSTQLPREKVIPKEKSLTKWEQYAKLKGIQKKKKGRMVWDNESQQYRPRWGYKRKDETKSWLLEVPENADPMVDQFEKKKKEKKERIAKNELQRLRNIARATKSKVPGVGLTPTAAPSKDTLGKALAVSHKSTASLGKFMETLPKEKLKGLGKKRKFDSNNTGEEEREKQKKILKKIADGTPVLDVNKAANVAQHKEEKQRAASKTEDGGRRKKAGGKHKGGKTFGGKGKKAFGGKGKKGGGGKGGKKRR